TMCVSSFATTSIEEVAKAATGPLWFQLYVQPDRGFTSALLQRAEAAGCRALLVTVDTPVIGTRNREVRAGFRLPPGLEREDLKGLRAGASAVSDIEHENRKGLLAGATTVAPADEGTISSAIFDPKLTWSGIEWIRSFAKIPVVLKCILSPEGGALAGRHGARWILLSTH